MSDYCIETDDEDYEGVGCYRLEVFDIIGIDIQCASNLFGALENNLGDLSREFYAHARWRRHERERKAEQATVDHEFAKLIYREAPQ